LNHLNQNQAYNLASLQRYEKKHTLSAENMRGGTVKGNRCDPPAIICFLTAQII
jgi:hypothetical protein